MTDLKDLEERIAYNEAHGLYTSPAVRELIEELKSLRAEVADLRMQRDEHIIDNQHAYDFARNKGEALEREATVAWLRARGEHDAVKGNHHRAEAVWDAAAVIERGEHRKEKS